MTSLGKLVFNDTHSRHPTVHSDSSCKKTQQYCNDSSNNTTSLSLAFENLFYMPHDIVENYGHTISTLDISHNKFNRNLHFLAEFEQLTSLNLDNNNVDGFTIFPFMPKLRLLWLNNNNIKEDELFPFLRNLNKSLPNLQYLSMMENKAAPSYFNGSNFYDYLQYRLLVISRLPRLVHLDDRTITNEQRSEAKRLFKKPLCERLLEKTSMLNCGNIDNNVVLKTVHEKLSTFVVNPVFSLREKLKSVKSNLIV